MADVNGVPQIEMGGHRRQIVGVVVHVMSFPHLTGPAMASTIMGHNAIPVAEEKQHLRVPVVGRKWPPVAKDDWLSFTPILVENLNAVPCFNEAHVSSYLIRPAN
jgi:hypothetical protein